MPTALITGITGQDGSHLADFLLAKGYRVYGLVRSASAGSARRIEAINSEVALVPFDLAADDAPTELGELLETSGFDEIYNLAAPSFVPESWDGAALTAESAAIGVTRLLDAVRQISPRTRFFQASTSEMFGRPRESPQRETTPFCPRNPYGTAKLYGHFIVQNYREHFGLFAASGILFNHEGPRRGLDFVTRKISHGAARIRLGLTSELALGNLDARRDWGFAGDFVRAMWLMLQHETADDFVIGTGTSHSVGEFVEIAFGHAGLDWRKHVVLDPSLIRPAESSILVADSTKAQRVLGWRPETSFEELIRMMVDEDIRALRSELQRNAVRAA